jgi:phenylalanyl-tRNA synthetase alpha chain
MTLKTLDAASLRRALSLRDLSDPVGGPHAMQILLRDVVRALVAAWDCDVLERRECPIVSCAEGYDRLGYPPTGRARDARYTRYLNERTILRTQTSAAIPRLLDELRADERPDLLLVCPGLVYRRDTIDRLHVGEPHQVDLWRLRRGPKLEACDLQAMVAEVCAALWPGRRYRTSPARHPYTEQGLEIEVREGREWVEVGECGLAAPWLLADCGHDTGAVNGLAMGLGLDRALMLRKGIRDIRLLRARDARVAAQLQDLEPYRPVSKQPAVRRDLSLAIAAGTHIEELGDRVREALGSAAACVEHLEIVAETAQGALPAQALRRLGLVEGQVNVLLRVVLRHPTASLRRREANQLRDRIYLALHEGRAGEWTARSS